MSSCSRGRSHSPANFDKNQETKDKIPFGKRIGANFRRDDSNCSIALKNRLSKTTGLASRVGSNEEGGGTMINFEVLEEYDDGTECGVKYRRKRPNLANNSALFKFQEPMPDSQTNFGDKVRIGGKADQDEIGTVANQLKWIQRTQDEILESLRHDVELIQMENTILRQNNSKLQNQVSQLNQLVADLSFDLRQIRDYMSAKEKLGVPLPFTEFNGRRDTKGHEDGKGLRNKLVTGGSSIAVLTPSDGSVNARRERRCREGRPPRTSRDGSSKKRPSSSRTVPTNGANSREPSKGSRKLKENPTPPEPDANSSCFGGLFGRRKNTN